MMRLVEVVCAFAFGVIVMGFAHDTTPADLAPPNDEQAIRFRNECPERIDYRLQVLVALHRNECYCHYEPLTVSKFTPKSVTRKCDE
jgi:hypothetical protein